MRHTTFTTRPTLCVVVVALLASFLGAVEPVHAGAAVGPRIDIPAECAVPGGAPTCTYRIDRRPPEVIFEEGFAPRGDNDRLVEHAVDYIDRPESDSAFVATAREPEVANVLMRERGQQAWVYAVWTSEDFYSLNSSLGEFARDLAADGRTADAEHVVRLINRTRAVDEWSALGGIPAEQVIGAFPQQSSAAAGDWQGWVENPAATPPDTVADVAPYSISPDEFDHIPPCRPGTSREGDCSAPTTEEQLAEIHEDFDSASSEARFTALPEEVGHESGVLLGPLTQTNQALSTFDSGTGAAGFADLRTALAESIPADLGRLEAVTTSDALISGVMSTLGKTVDIGSELIPYLGVAATGYALREDIDHGKWVDAAFDAVALALQSLEMIQPELAIFVEPALIADLVAQWLVHQFQPGPPPTPAPDLGHLWELFDEFDSAPEQLERALTTEAVKHLGNAFSDLREEHVDTTLHDREIADLETLEQMRRGYVMSALRHAIDAGDGSPLPTGQIREERDALLAEIEATFTKAEDDRVRQYREASESQLEVSVKHAAEHSDAHGSMVDAFSDQVALPHLRSLENQVFLEAKKTGSTDAIDYPDICFGEAESSTFCTHYRKMIAMQGVVATENLHRQRMSDGSWWQGVLRYLSEPDPGASWPDDFVDFTADQPRAGSTAQVCSDRRVFYSQDGWQRATVQQCAQATEDHRTRVTTNVSDVEYYWELGWYSNDRHLQVAPTTQLRKHGKTLTEVTHTSGTVNAITMVRTLSHGPEPISGGHTVRIRTALTGMYWSTPSDSPGPSDITIEQSLYLPAA